MIPVDDLRALSIFPREERSREIVALRLLWGLVLAATWSGFASGQEPKGADVLAAAEAKCKAAAKRAGKSVVAIARVNKSDNAGGFQVPNLGRLGVNARLDELFPTDADFIPSDYGAGVVIDQSGLILTTYHVLGNVSESDYFVWLQHKPFKAMVVAADGWFDLAVLKIDSKGLQPLAFGDAKGVEKGDFVIALGNPQAIARDGNVTATWGIVGNLKRRAPQGVDRSGADRAGAERLSSGGARETLHHYGTLMHVDARLNIGYSGGALLNLQGEMIGLITAYAGSAMSAQSASFAIPVDEHFRQALEQLKAGKSPEFGFLGIGLQPLDARMRRQGQHGSVVESVLRGSAAARAEIENGDVVTHVNDLPIYDDDELIREVSCLPPGATVKLRLQRTGEVPSNVETIEKQATLTKRSSTSARPPIATVPPASWRGMLVDDATTAPGDALLAVQLPATGGLWVVEVAKDSAAWNGGMRAGMFITSVSGRSVTTAREFFKLVKDQSDAVPLQTLTAAGDAYVNNIPPGNN